MTKHFKLRVSKVSNKQYKRNNEKASFLKQKIPLQWNIFFKNKKNKKNYIFTIPFVFFSAVKSFKFTCEYNIK